MLLLLLMRNRYNPRQGVGYMIFVSIRQSNIPCRSCLFSISSRNFKNYFHTVITSANVDKMFIPVLFARLCITFHLSRNESYTRCSKLPISKMRNLRQFSAWPRGCDIARCNVSNDCRQVRAFLYICSLQTCYPVAIE